ncbi:MAG: APC family permease [Anaerolineales bacterium]
MTQLNEEHTTIIERDLHQKPPRSWKHWFIGRPLQTADAPHQTIGKAVGLAVFASDALSSTAYASQEIMVILAAAGTAAFGYVFPISLAIVSLLIIVALSYEQTIHAYPDGGGAYIVSRDNLGEFPALVAGAALLTDYILTVSVSISSGVAQLVSAFPVLEDYRVSMAVLFVLFIMTINLRGVKESGMAFAIPTYFFVVMMYLTVIIGIVRYAFGSLGMVPNPPPLETLKETVVPISLFILLHAFSSGTAALTGIEAISNGITAFKEPRSKNAGITLIWMTVILSSLFLGISFLVSRIGAVPSEAETIISQLGRVVFNGRGPLYLGTISATTVILIMAANTAFADFPRLSALVAKDSYLPRQMAFRGSRLVYSTGIVTLSVVASVLIIIFQASVTRLIPLYAIGVFLSFTLSQAGMARRWWKIGHILPGEQVVERGSTLRYEKNWQFKMFINGLGAVCTLVVMFIFAITKFKDGAWVVLILIPVLVWLFLGIHGHYKSLAEQLSLQNYLPQPTQKKRHRVLVLVSSVHRGTLDALRYARTLSDDITALHVVVDPEDAVKTRAKWETWGDGTRLVLLDSPYRLLIEPVLEYLDEIIRTSQPNELITVVVPQFVPSKRVHQLLHSNTADILREELLNNQRVVIAEVSYLV